MAQQKSPFILVPLYIYPTPTSWEPLFLAAKSCPDLEFLVVVNPGNGPGPEAMPDVNYLDALGKLSMIPNAKVIGYVHCSYGKRATTAIEKDILTYQGWKIKDGISHIRMEGIFFDEVPSSTVYVQYMANLSRAVRKALESSDGEAGRNSTVIYNPGVVIDPAFYQTADFVVAFENQATQWDSTVVRGAMAALPTTLRAKSVAIAHSSPNLHDALQLAEKVHREGFVGQFITTQPGYTAWCLKWDAYVQKVRGLTGHEQ
ncbi:putative cell surface spherulin 4-like protein [Phaeoacremonium minimum UCRPA7]|uniref:Putative cell surface spherulin 4-like protein n=1 Tax=Phaeoacremonium minimum (strain UCR-PA7) TaxID=1286976 RepID=R8B8U1_PHAM7|nr:putative cell surface spherulin 4-like protein [Phaeoacremonium minimum UCRPA7]EON95716.1 putative cell surface spherulin 4-like protein [Phaeoacremonium minimum UCRPA7]